ncbi:helix-turn-helix domain-containing protein [Bifidobacterium castoris]|uniref:helix-turn-helix domain-containing protein n=1 Tax=Bifidobacterium castoris TaxID=2306972 RepID=UPI000F7DB87C|nr:helix-turn-helix transcriptional regulator [Bifidobacterium castoris]
MQIIDDARQRAPIPISDRALAKAINVSPPRVANLFSHSHGSPTLREFLALCSVLQISPSQTLDAALSNVAAENNSEPSAAVDDANAALVSADDDTTVPDMSSLSADEQAAYVASHLEQFDIAAKKGDLEREQEAFEELP